MLTYLKIFYRLGIGNLFRIFFYRLQLRANWFQYSLPIRQPIEGEFYSGDFISAEGGALTKNYHRLLKGNMLYFSHQLVEVDRPPNWFVNLETGGIFPRDEHWSRTNEFHASDIKLVWEPSRFHWLTLASQGFASTNDNAYIDLMNTWLSDWSKENPTNRGANWKCGQEASIRVINILLSSLVLGEIHRPLPSLIKMVREHCQRIYKTLHYAIAQDNNHATSEASALFIASSWIAFIGEGSRESKRWLLKSRRILEKRVDHLVMDDGTFSQYSTNYHRLFLDSVSLVEYFRIKFNQDEFSKQYKNKINLAIDWLWQLTDACTGFAPNLGSNDGAQLLQLAGKDYLDFRPSIQLASALFGGCCLYRVDCNGILDWLGIDMRDLPYKPKNEQSKLFKCGGYVSIARGVHKGLLRYPKFKFRPCQADFLHLDIMVDGEPIMVDGGTYSYNKGRKWLDYFSGIESHNTIHFDGAEPMTRLSRFLFGDWPSGELLSFREDRAQTFAQVKYQDYLGRSHERAVILENGIWTITDKVSNFSEYAILRWRLCRSDWSVVGNQVVSSKARVSFEIDKNSIIDIKIVKGYESRYYNEMLDLDVIEIKIHEACAIKTTIEFPRRED